MAFKRTPERWNRLRLVKGAVDVGNGKKKTYHGELIPISWHIIQPLQYDYEKKKLYIEPLRTGTAFPGKLLSGKNRAVRISLCLEVDLSAIAGFLDRPLPRAPEESPWHHGPMAAEGGLGAGWFGCRLRKTFCPWSRAAPGWCWGPLWIYRQWRGRWPIDDLLKMVMWLVCYSYVKCFFFFVRLMQCIWSQTARPPSQSEILFFWLWF